jgi:hypothetical protein
MSRKPASPEAAEDQQQPQHQEPGTNKVEHEPDPEAEPLPEGERKYVPKSPYTAGND